MTRITIKAEHINPFIRATVDTLAKMANLTATPGKVALKDGSENLSYDVSGIIGLSGGAKGSVGLSFPRLTALALTRAFSGEKAVSTNMMVDAVGELANIVAGAAKRDLTQYQIQISLPTVILGENHAVNGPLDAGSMIVPFESPAGRFDLAVCFKSVA